MYAFKICNRIFADISIFLMRSSNIDSPKGSGCEINLIDQTEKRFFTLVLDK